MLLREDLLTPIPGDNPGGQDLRYAPIYDKIKEARREDDELAQGAWQHERKLADPVLVIKLSQEAIAKQSKDLQIAAWLTEALLKKNGFAGFREGLDLCRNLILTFWDHLYPQLDDGDAEFRAAPLDWIGSKFEFPVKSVPLTRDGYDFYKYKESRSVGYEDQAKEKDRKTARDAALKAGKLAPEVFDKSFGETSKEFYAQNEKNLDASLEALAALDEASKEKFGDAGPAFGKVKAALDEVRHVVHGFLQKKREIEPDPIEDVPPPPPEPVPSVAVADGVATGGGAGAAVAPAMSPGFTMMVQAAAEPADRRDAVAGIVAAAAFLRKREPSSPAPYLMLRGLRWGELRSALQAKDPTQLEAPPTDIRRQIKQLALAAKWKELIEVAESVMALPCSRAWLDLQRFVVDACIALGPEYQLIAMAIRSELRALVRDVPELLDLTLMDDTPAANADTQTWLRELAEEPQASTPKLLPLIPLSLDGDSSAGWHQKFVDAFQLATQAVRSGQETKGFEILQLELQRQRSGRGRFERRLQLVQLCVSTGKEAIMQPILEDLMAAVETHKLEEWEDREKLAAALATILKASKKIQADAKEKQKLFERICRLDPVQALAI
jgi:type VI secretion system protein ImpA